MGENETFEYYRKTFMRDNYRCVYCNREMLGDIDDWLSLEVDHIIPQAIKKDDDRDNLATSCNVCNKMKSSYYNPEIENRSTRKEKIAFIAIYIAGKREVEQKRWRKAAMQYNYYLENNNEPVDDSELKVIRIEK